MDVGIAFVAGLFLGSIMGIFFYALLLVAKHEEDFMEQMDRGLFDGKNDQGCDDRFCEKYEPERADPCG